MNITGSYTFDAPASRVWETLILREEYEADIVWLIINKGIIYNLTKLRNIYGPKQARLRHPVDEWSWNTLNYRENAVVCPSKAAHCLPHGVFRTP